MAYRVECFTVFFGKKIDKGHYAHSDIGEKLTQFEREGWDVVNTAIEGANFYVTLHRDD